MKAQPRITTLGFALLGLINRTPATGYELMKVFEMTPLKTYSNSPGAIYPALKKLKNAGLIKTDHEKPSRGQCYVLSPAGKKAFRAWLSQKPARKEGEDPGLAEEMLRFTFMDDVLSASDQAAFLDSLIDTVKARIAHLRAFYKERKNDLRRNDRLAMGAGIAHLEATVKWAGRAKTGILKERQE